MRRLYIGIGAGVAVAITVLIVVIVLPLAGHQKIGWTGVAAVCDVPISDGGTYVRLTDAGGRNVMPSNDPLASAGAANPPAKSATYYFHVAPGTYSITEMQDVGIFGSVPSHGPDTVTVNAGYHVEWTCPSLSH